MQLPPNPVKILAGAGFGRISKIEPDAGAKIRYIPSKSTCVEEMKNG